LYPYALDKNPFPSSPTPNLNDVHILGGKRHRESRNSIVSCINELAKKTNSIDNNERFRIITVIQDVGSGKTHLTLHIKISEINEKSIVSYLDLSQIYPKNIPSIYQSMINGFPTDYVNDLKKELLYYISNRSKSNHKIAKKIFKLGFFESIIGKGIDNKIHQIMENKLEPNLDFIDDIFDTTFSKTDITIIKTIIQNQFENKESITLIDMINRLSTLSKINLKIYNKISLYQFDEFDNNQEILSFMKALINAHIPNTVLMLILTPSSYMKIASEDSSVFDRLEKANYKIDLAGSNSFEEICDIVLEYIKYYNQNKDISEIEKTNLLSKIKIVYDDFDFRNIRSILNIMFNAFEIAAENDVPVINEYILDETLQKTYPGVRIKGSIMNISISDYIKIKNQINSNIDIKTEIIHSINELINYLHRCKIKCKYENYRDLEELHVIYKDSKGLISQISMLLKESSLSSLENIASHNLEYSLNDLNKYPKILRNNNTHFSINLDHSKIVDLLYLKYKFENNLDTSDDHNKIILLAQSINLC
jgi:hypothetical protein